MKIFTKIAHFLRGIFHLNSIENKIDNIEKQLEQISNRLDEKLRQINGKLDDQLGRIHAELDEINAYHVLLNEKFNLYIKLMNKTNNILPQNRVHLITEYPFAFYSDDYKYPRGAKNDNTHCLRFVKKCEEIFGRKISYLDLGCAGGGLVFDFLARDHFAVGLEGSDYPSKNLSGEWSVIDDYLFNCDITKEFKITDAKTGQIYRFDVIGFWEVFEHIPEEFLPQLMTNIKNHLKKDGLLTASIAVFRDEDKELGAVYHVNVKDREWWEKFFKSSGFELVDGLFEVEDFPRGSGNRRRVSDWSAIENPEMGFHIVAKLKKG